MPSLARRCYDSLPKISAALRLGRAVTMLSGLSTPNMNAITTGIRTLSKPAISAVSGVIDPFVGLATGRRTHFISDAGAEMAGIFRSIPPLLKAAGRRARSTREIDEVMAKGLFGTTGKVVRAPLKVLSATDQFFFDKTFHGEMWRQAQAQAIKTKRPVAEIMEEQIKIANALDPIESQMADLEKIIEAARKGGPPVTREQAALYRSLTEQANTLHAKSFIRKAAFMAEKTIFTARENQGFYAGYERAALDHSMDALDKMAEYNPLVGTIWPFRRTQAHVVREALRSTPLGMVWAAKRAADWAAQGVPREVIQERVVDDMSQAIAGTAAMYYFIHLAASGQLKANPFKEAAPAERATEEAAGIVPNSVQIGDWSVPISRLEPFGSMVLNAARSVEDYKAGKSPDTLAEDLFKTTENMMLLSAKEAWLDPLAEFTEAIQDDKSLARYMQGIGASFVPRAITANFDQRVKEQPAKGGAVTGFINALPGQGETKLGLFGEERTTQAPWMSRAFGRTGKIGNDPIAQEMVRVGAYHLPPTSLDAKEREALKISLGEDRLMRIVKGQAQKRMVTAVMQSPQYQQAPDQLKKEMIDYAYRQASDGINKRARMLKQAKMPLTSRALLGL